MQRTTISPRLRLVALAASLLLVGVLLVRTSSAAFNATTSTSQNSFTAGTLALTNNEGVSALFGDISDMVPGDFEEQCIQISYTGPASADEVKVYASYTDDSDFGNHLDVTVTESTSGTEADCSDFGSDAGTTYDATALSSVGTDYLTGQGTWDPTTTSESRTYKVRVELGDDTPNSFQGDAVTQLVFTWEVQAGTGSVT